MKITPQLLDPILVESFQKVILEFHDNRIYNEYDFRASLYYQLRQRIEQEKWPLIIYFDYHTKIKSGQYGYEPIKPDFILWNDDTEEDVICGELKFDMGKAIPKHLIARDLNKLMKLNRQQGYQKGFFLCISKQSSESLLAPLINKALWNQKHKLSLLKAVQVWTVGYLCILFYSINYKQAYKITFPNRVNITKLDS